jgi:hypothetical protein
VAVLAERLGNQLNPAIALGALYADSGARGSMRGACSGHNRVQATENLIEWSNGTIWRKQ